MAQDKHSDAAKASDHRLAMINLSRRRPERSVQHYTFTLLAAMSTDCVVSTQLVEGGVDAIIFENFIYETFSKLRSNSATKDRPIVLLMDNATIHRH